MKRKFYVCITFITICMFVFLTGCGITNSQENISNTNSSSVEQEEPENEVAGLILISNTIDEHSSIRSKIMYDPETMVMYVLVRDSHNAATASGFSVMLNADGTPRLYNPKN